MTILAEHNAWSALEQAIIALSAIGVAATGAAVTYFLRRLHQQGERTYRHINGIEENEAIPNGDDDSPSLGAVLRDVQRDVADGFRRNDETHEAIIRTVEAQGETVHDHGRRIDAHRDAIDRLGETIKKHHPDET